MMLKQEMLVCAYYDSYTINDLVEEKKTFTIVTVVSKCKTVRTGESYINSLAKWPNIGKQRITQLLVKHIWL